MRGNEEDAVVELAIRLRPLLRGPGGSPQIVSVHADRAKRYQALRVTNGAEICMHREGIELPSDSV